MKGKRVDQVIVVVSQPDKLGNQSFDVYWMDYRGLRGQGFYTNLERFKNREDKKDKCLCVIDASTPYPTTPQIQSILERGN